MIRLPIFVFGTLRQRECNHHYLAGAFDRMQPAKLFGFRRVEPLMIARETGSVVEGELFDLAPTTYARTLQGCDHLEEIPIGELGRVDIHARRIMDAAKWRKARKLRAVLS